MTRMDILKPILERFLSKINVVESGCWIWTASKNQEGYGYFWVTESLTRAHRFIFEYYYGSICPDLTIDHLCRNRACVNPIHLEEVTTRENVMRGIGISADNLRKTHCKRGHEFTPMNTYFTKTNARICRICHNMHSKVWNKKNRGRHPTQNLIVSISRLD